ncbi:hypothetical protein L6452_17322 [Arctium lappa]|uniref:Uncharacterized protein n=1 Tax=Arctium lappa TaxID=4217 RepID=A0ACB9C327_ARCLA|nr:hypothetical protein L6452_17322 [Arctium lappa]
MERRDGKSFTYNSSINIAVAVAIDGRLITSVLQNADKVDIYSLSRKWKELVDKARAKQLQPQEYSTCILFVYFHNHLKPTAI